MRDDSSGTWITGRSLSGMVIRRGTSGLSSSASGTWYTWATSAGFGTSSTFSLAHVDPAAGQRPLAGVGAQRRRTPGQEKARASFVVGEEHHRHRGRAAPVRGDRLPLESGEVLLNPRLQPVVESARVEIGHALADVHPSPQLRTREWPIRNMTRLAGMVLPFQSRSRRRYFSWKRSTRARRCDVSDKNSARPCTVTPHTSPPPPTASAVTHTRGSR